AGPRLEPLRAEIWKYHLSRFLDPGCWMYTEQSSLESTTGLYFYSPGLCNQPLY
ncbi:hypothetical protein STEG23_034106, partial [Scotinomys teguina]